MKRTLKASLVVSLLGLAGTAQAHQLCLPHEEAIARLQRDYGETAQGLGLGNRGQSVVELFTSESGSWTVLITRTNGLSCITASGENWTPTETEIPQMAPPIADNGSTTGNPRKSPAGQGGARYSIEQGTRYARLGRERGRRAIRRSIGETQHPVMMRTD